MYETNSSDSRSLATTALLTPPDSDSSTSPTAARLQSIRLLILKALDDSSPANCCAVLAVSSSEEYDIIRQLLNEEGRHGVRCNLFPDQKKLGHQFRTENPIGPVVILMAPGLNHETIFSITS
jgi:hypothetical protein